MSATNQGTPVMVQGRIVWTVGDLFKGRPKTDFNTRQPVIDSRTGQQKVEYGFGLAVPKSVLGQMDKDQPGEVWRVMHEVAQALYQGRQVPPNFAMKYKDGDGVDDQGIPFSQRKGYAGHIILACTTTLPIKFFKYENGQNFLINEGIKCGDYVNVQLNIKAHPASGTFKPGLYLNPNAVQFLGYGEEIINTPSGDQLFGTAAPPLPPGASATPIAPTGMLVPPGQSGMPGQNYAPPMQQPAQPAVPHYGVLPPAHQPPQQMGQPPMGNGYAPPVTPPQQGYAQPPMSPSGQTQFGQPATQPAFPSSGGAPVPGMPPQPR